MRALALTGLLVFALSAALPGAPAVAGEDGEASCPGSGWRVDGGLADERALACTGIDHATEFLQACGVRTGAMPRVRLLEALPVSCGVPVYGLYDGGTDAIALGRPALCAARAPEGSLFDLLPPRLAFASLAAHEAAHAHVHAAGLGADSHVEHEYIAAVVQFALLPEADRQRLLDRIGVRGQVGIWQLNPLLHAMQPLLFSGLSWRHFADEPDGCALIRAMVQGTLRLPDFSAM